MYAVVIHDWRMYQANNCVPNPQQKRTDATSFCAGAAIQKRIAAHERRIKSHYDAFHASQALATDAEDALDFMANSLGAAEDEAQRGTAACGHLRAELQRRAAAVEAAQGKLEAARVRLALEGQQLGSLQQKVGGGSGKGGRRRCRHGRETFLRPSRWEHWQVVTTCSSWQHTHTTTHTLSVPCITQVQELESLRAEEAKRGEALERELAALAQRQFRASQALHEAQVGGLLPAVGLGGLEGGGIRDTVCLLCTSSLSSRRQTCSYAKTP